MWTVLILNNLKCIDNPCWTFCSSEIKESELKNALLWTSWPLSHHALLKKNPLIPHLRFKACASFDSSSSQLNRKLKLLVARTWFNSNKLASSCVFEWSLTYRNSNYIRTHFQQKKPHSPPSFCFLVVWDTPNLFLKLYFPPLSLGVVFISQTNVGSILRIFFLLVIDWGVSVVLCGCLVGNGELKLISFNPDATLQQCVKPENHSTKEKKNNENRWREQFD